MNKVILIGRLTADPEQRATQHGISVTNFTIAVNRRTGKPDYFRINAWRGLADTCKKYLSKGRQVAVVGELQANVYQNKDGQTRFYLDVNADEIKFLSSPDERKTEEKPEVKDDEWQDISTNDLPWEV